MYASNDGALRHSNLGMAASGIGLAETAVRQTEVEGEMSRLAKAVEILGMTADNLTQRLQPVRRPTGVAGNKEPIAPEPVLCDLAATIRTRRQSVESITSGLQQALNELEL